MINKCVQWTAFCGLFRKETKRIFRIWRQTLLPPLITALLYFLIFGQVVGRRVGEINSHSYLLFIAPGIAMLSVITASYGNVVSSFFGARFNRSFEEIQVSPMRISAIIFGYCLPGVMRGVISGLGVLLLARFFQAYTIEHPLLMLLSFIFSANIFALGGLINGVFARTFDDTSFMTTFILTPLIFLGGVFYNIHHLTGFWHQVSKINPIFYMIDLSRYTILGGSHFWLTALSIIVFFNILLYCFAWRLLRTGFRIQS